MRGNRGFRECGGAEAVSGAEIEMLFFIAAAPFWFWAQYGCREPIGITADFGLAGMNRFPMRPGPEDRVEQAEAGSGSHVILSSGEL